MSEGILFDIQHFSLSDGPGIRTTVFLKGCGLRCKWCHNPESQSALREIMFDERKCRHCGYCYQACVNGAIHYEPGCIPCIERTQCIVCGRCAETCYSGALRIAGKRYNAEEVLNEVLKDKRLYQLSNGGVTFSGGEPLLQAEFIYDIMSKLKDERIHIAVDTAGDIQWAAFEKVTETADLFLFDLKCVDADLHRQLTGVDNSRLIENLKRLDELKPIWIRIPIILGINDSNENLNAVAELLAPLKHIERVELLPYHDYGRQKYRELNRTAESYAAPDSEELERMCDRIRGFGLNAFIGTNTVGKEC